MTDFFENSELNLGGFGPSDGFGEQDPDPVTAPSDPDPDFNP